MVKYNIKQWKKYKCARIIFSFLFKKVNNFPFLGGYKFNFLMTKFLKSFNVKVGEMQNQYTCAFLAFESFDDKFTLKGHGLYVLYINT